MTIEESTAETYLAWATQTEIWSRRVVGLAEGSHARTMAQNVLEHTLETTLVLGKLLAALVLESERVRRKAQHGHSGGSV